MDINDRIRKDLLKKLDKDIICYFQNIQDYYWIKELKYDLRIFNKITFKIIKSKKLKSFYLNNY